MAAAAAPVAALAAAWRQSGISGSSSEAAPRHGSGAVAARLCHQWRWQWLWGRMTKAAVVMVWWSKKKCLSIFSILMFGREAVCPDGLFVLAIFQESGFYLNSLICASKVVFLHSMGRIILVVVCSVE